MKKLLILCSIFLCSFPIANAKNVTEIHIVIKNHHFVPELIEAPAHKRLKLIIDNQDSSTEKFESHDLRREKIIAGKSKGIIFVNPLKPGKYKFFGEFHEDTTQGQLIVK